MTDTPNPDMILRNVEYGELPAFFESLDARTRDTVDNPMEWASKIEFMTGIRIEDDLAAIGGLKRSRLNLRFSFHIVKPKYQKLGLGHDITQDIVRYAREKGYSYFLGTLRMQNLGHLPFFLKCGYRLVSLESDLYVRSVYPLDLKGEIMVDLFRMLFNLYLPLRSIRRTLSRQKGT